MAVLLICVCLLATLGAPQALTYDPGPLMQLTQYRQRHRRTLDGRLCAAAFVQNGQTFTDCTTSATPSGDTGQEWCYVEVQLIGKGPRDWDYCRPSIDYDYLRAVAADSLRSQLKDSEQMVNKLMNEKKKLDDVLERYERVCLKDLNVTENRLQQLEETLQHAEHSLANAIEAKSSVIALEASLEKLSATYSEQLRQALKQPENCRAMRGYEDDGEPDGLMGTYFPTPYFVSNGLSKHTRVDSLIDFVWNARSPAPNIPAESFSVRWEGFLGVPETGEYKLITETACGARIFIDRTLVLIDRMPDTDYIADSDQEKEVKLLPPRGPGGVNRVTSKPIYLKSSERVPIRIEMIHSTHLLFTNEDLATLRLMWSGPHMKTEVIPPTAFYSSNTAPVLKVARLPAGVTEVSYVFPGSQPFLDRPELYIGDLPPELEGAKLVKFFASRQIGSFQLEVNQPCWAWVGHDRAKQNSLDISGVSFERKDDRVTLLESHLGPDARATASFPYALESGLLPSAGVYEVKVTDPTSMYVLILQALPKPRQQCSGALEIISDPSGAEFDRCTASSTLSAEYSCEYGLNLHHRDAKYSVWRAMEGRGAGEYMEVFFKHELLLTQFKFKPLDDPLMWPAELSLTFSTSADPDRPPQIFTLVYSANSDLLTYQISPVVTDYVKAEITQLYAAGQSTGGSFEFIGSTCEDVSKPLGLGYEKQIPSYNIVDCEATLASLPDVPGLRSDLIIRIDCPQTCSIPNSPQVFGTNVYSIDSSVCLAAVHAGLQSRVSVRVVGGQNVYRGSNRNGLESRDHGPQDLSFVLEPRESGLITTTHDTPRQKKESVIVFHPITPTLPRLPPNVAIDDGGVFAEKTSFAYPPFGWSHPAQPVACDAKATASSTTEMEDAFNFWLLRGGIAFPPTPPGSEECAEYDCSPNSWSIQLEPHAEINLTVQVGDPCPTSEERKVFVLQANGVDMVSEGGIELEPGQNYFVSGPKIHLGGDGKLTLTATSSVAKSHTTLIAVKILH